MGWSDWVNVISDVSDIASGIAGLFGSTDKSRGDADTYKFAGIDWVAPAGASEVYAMNTNGGPIAMTYVMSQLQGGTAMSTTSAIQALPSQSYYDATAHLQQFQSGGQLTITPYDATADSLTEALTFAVKAVSIAVSLAIVGGVRGGFSPNASGGYDFYLTTTGPRLTGGNVQVTLPTGASANAGITFQNPANDGTNGVAHFPAGLLNANSIVDVSVDIDMDSSSFRSIIGGSLKHSKPIADLRALRRKSA